MKRPITALALLLSLFVSSAASAATFFVRDTINEDGVQQEDARVATNLIKSSVSSRSKDQAIEDEFRADYVLQPRLMRLGDSWILTVEKIRGQETLFAAQSKVPRIDQLDRAARSTTFAAIDEPSLPAHDRNVANIEVEPGAPYRIVNPAPSAAAAVPPATAPAPTITAAPPGARTRATAPAIDMLPGRKVSYWTIGVGPFIGRRLDSDNMMYNFMLGHLWDINPRANVKVLAEANLSSGRENARFLNFGTGASLFLPTQSPDTAPYVTGDIGYGFARDANGRSAEGFSLGAGIGYQFFRTTETTLDLLFRYAIIFDAINDGGDPSVTGLRLAVNF